MQAFQLLLILSVLLLNTSALAATRPANWDDQLDNLGEQLRIATKAFSQYTSKLSGHLEEIAKTDPELFEIRQQDIFNIYRAIRGTFDRVEYRREYPFKYATDEEARSKVYWLGKDLEKTHKITEFLKAAEHDTLFSHESITGVQAFREKRRLESENSKVGESQQL